MNDPAYRDPENMSSAERARLTLEVLRELRELREEIASFLTDIADRVEALEKGGRR